MSLDYYYGTECPHCEKMNKLMDRLEAENPVHVERIEVWHNKENMEKLEQCDKEDECGGVPFCINTDSGATLCGEVLYDELKAWALNK